MKLIAAWLVAGVIGACYFIALLYFLGATIEMLSQ
jgi:hypothetical protein